MSKGWRNGIVKDEIGNKYNKLTVIKRAGYYTTTSGANRQATWECKCDCGNTCIVQGAKLRFHRVKSCGCYRIERAKARIGPLNSQWRGGKWTNNDGYVFIRHNKKYKLEHRFVMETYLNRVLTSHETVHHKNGIKNDNRIENLELRVGRHGKHQSITDLVAWAKEILQKYPDVITD